MSALEQEKERKSERPMLEGPLFDCRRRRFFAAGCEIFLFLRAVERAFSPPPSSWDKKRSPSRCLCLSNRAVEPHQNSANVACAYRFPGSSSNAAPLLS